MSPKEKAKPSKIPAFTPREAQVLEYVVKGYEDGEIAKALGITFYTAKDHVTNCRRKLKLRNRVQLAVWAVRNMGL